MDRWIDGWTDRWTDKLTDVHTDFPVFYRTLSPLGPLLSLLPNCHGYVVGQGKGTPDHLLPLRDWFSSTMGDIILKQIARSPSSVGAIISKTHFLSDPLSRLPLCAQIYQLLCLFSSPSQSEKPSDLALWVLLIFVCFFNVFYVNI